MKRFETPVPYTLVTGPAGGGKPTTLASMLDKINGERHEPIITAKDPIEYLHKHKGRPINQREVEPFSTMP